MSFASSLESIRKQETEKDRDIREDITKDAFTNAVEEALASPKGLVIAAITSNTQASFESDLTPYGAGKTTLALRLMYHFNHFDPETKRYWDTDLDENDIRNWETTNKQLWYYPSKILRSMDTAIGEHRRMLAGGWDDTQYTAGARTGLPTAIEELVGDLTTDRPEIGVLFLTMPNVMGVASAIRNLIQYELIVHSRGRYEVQRVSYRKNFSNPKKDWMRLEYISGLSKEEKKEPDFAALPLAEQRWYDEWRAGQKGLKRRRTIQTLERYERVTQEKAIEENPPPDLSAPLKPRVRKGWGED